MTQNNTNFSQSQLPNNSDALLTYLVSQFNTGQKNWLGYPQQRLVGAHIAYEIAKYHADKMTPEECAEYAVRLNNAIYAKILKGIE